MKQDSVNKLVLLLLLVFITALFLAMIRQFLMAIFLAGIFSALSTPFYRWLRKRFGNRPALASLVTLLLIIFVVLLPLSGLPGIVTAQAIKVGESVRPWVQKQLSEPVAFSELLQKIPFYEQVYPYREVIFKKIRILVNFATSKYLLPGKFRN